MIPFGYNVIPIILLFICSIFCFLIPCMVYSTTESEGAEAIFSVTIGTRLTFTILFLAQALTKWNEYFVYLILQLITFIPSSIIRIPYLFFEQYLLALYNEYKLNNINQYVKQNNRKFL